MSSTIVAVHPKEPLRTSARAAELIARVNACLRRQARSVDCGAGRFDKGVHCLLIHDRIVDLAPTEVPAAQGLRGRATQPVQLDRP